MNERTPPSVAFNPPLPVDVNHGGINQTVLYAVCGDQALVRAHRYGQDQLTWVYLPDVRIDNARTSNVTVGPDSYTGDFIH